MFMNRSFFRIESRLARRRITCDLHCRHSVGSNLPMTSISSCRGGSVEVEADRTGMCTKDMYLGRRFFAKSWESRGGPPKCQPSQEIRSWIFWVGGIGGGALRFPWTKLPGIFKATVPFGWRNRRETIPWFRVVSYLPTVCDAKLTCQHILPKPFEVHNGTNIYKYPFRCHWWSSDSETHPYSSWILPPNPWPK